MKCVLSTILSLTAAMLAACSNSSTSSAEEPSTMLDSSSSEELSSSDEKYIVDGRDGQKYRVVTIGSQTWMAENLNFKTEKSHCYNDVDSNCTKYGRLYTWADAMDSAGVFSSTGKGCGFDTVCFPTEPIRGICPEGWHFPDAMEWYTLIKNSGGVDRAGETLKNEPFLAVERASLFWTSTDFDGIQSYDIYVYFCKGDCNYHQDEEAARVNRTETLEKTESAYLRCIRDDRKDSSSPFDLFSINKLPKSIEDTLVDSRDNHTYKTVTIGSQTWMAQNLNYETDNSSCYQNSSERCDVYGRYYTWTSAMKACPSGWHLPSIDDWLTLFSIVNTSRDGMLEKVLRSTSGWKTENGYWNSGYWSENGYDVVSFSVLPAGQMDDGEGAYAKFWTSSQDAASKNIYGTVFGTGKTMLWTAENSLVVQPGTLLQNVDLFNDDDGLSVRCIKD